MKKVFTLLTIILVNFNLYGQIKDSTDFEERPKSINEVIKQLNADSVVFYYNDRYQMVKPICATKFRISRVDSVLVMFTGEFVDHYIDSTIAIEGNYTNGKKEGVFKFYFPNGQLDQVGKYLNDKKIGVWEYYYENGNKLQILDFKKDEILVIEFWDEKGQHLVDSSKGNWFGYETSEKFVKIHGEILNGKKEGTWKKDIPSRNFTMNIEKYKDGKFISGKIISIANGSESYKDKTYCIVEQLPVFLMAEQFQINQCFKTQINNWEFASYPGGIETFYKEIREKLILNGTNNVRGITRILMTIDINGKMTNYKPISNIGYENDLINILETMNNWKPTKVNGKAILQPKIISFEIL
jgi:hypothetical protein